MASKDPEPHAIVIEAGQNIKNSIYEPEHTAEENSGSALSEVLIHNQPPNLPLWRRFVGLFWDSYVAEPRERKYIQKVDLHLFTYIMVGFFIKYLDQKNHTYAYVSGMKEDLHMHGNQRNFLVTFFNIGIIVGTVPAQMIQMKYIRPSLLIPACEISWSVAVMGMAAAKNVETFYALRFVVGFLESCSFPGYAVLLGSWFGPTQLAKRTALFENTNGLAGMFSGYLQAGLYTGLNKKGGLAGWRWLFIFDGIISIPIALFGFYAIPDLPHNTRARWLTQSDREYGLERMERFGSAAPTGLNFKAMKRVYLNLQLWVWVFLFLTTSIMAYGDQYFNLWLKAEHYSVVRINTIPTIGNAIGIIASFATGIYVDRTGRTKTTIVAILFLVLISNIILSIWYVPKAAIFFANFLSFVGSAARPIVMTWGQQFAQHDSELRQLLMATGSMFSYTFDAFLPLIIFPTYDAPHYKFGYQSLIIFGCLAFIAVFLLDYLIKRDLSLKKTKVTESGLAVPVREDSDQEVFANDEKRSDLDGV